MRLALNTSVAERSRSAAGWLQRWRVLIQACPCYAPREDHRDDRIRAVWRWADWQNARRKSSVRRDVRLVTVYDVLAPSAKEVAQRHGASVATDVASALAEDVEAVSIASSTDTHVDLITAAAKAG